MDMNVTLKIASVILKKARVLPAEKNRSLSSLLAKPLMNSVVKTDAHTKSSEAAVKKIQTAYALGGKPLKRVDLYER